MFQNEHGPDASASDATRVSIICEVENGQVMLLEYAPEVGSNAPVGIHSYGDAA